MTEVTWFQAFRALLSLLGLALAYGLASDLYWHWGL